MYIVHVPVQCGLGVEEAIALTVSLDHSGNTEREGGRERERRVSHTLVTCRTSPVLVIRKKASYM